MFDPDPKPRWSLPAILTAEVPLWMAVLAVAVVIVLTRQFALSAAQQNWDRERQALTEQLQMQQKAARTDARENRNAAYRLFGRTLGWAVRSAMMRGNLDLVDNYFRTLLDERAVTLAVLADRNGKIVVATDEQLEGRSFAQRFPAEMLKLTDITIERTPSGTQLAIPVFGLTTRLGTILVHYSGL